MRRRIGESKRVVPIEALHFIYDIIRQDEKLLLKELESSGLTYKIVNAVRLSVEIPLKYDLATAFIRTVSHVKAQLISGLYEAFGYASINPARSILLGNNKAISLALLSKEGIPVPKSIIMFSSDEIGNVEALLGSPIVIKPVEGSWGRFVSLVGDLEELKLLLRHRDALNNPLHHVHIIQEYVNKPNRDIRAMVIEDRVVGAIYRYATSDDWRTNMARGGKAEALKVDEELERICVKAAKAIGAYYAGVDVVESEDGYKVLEVNVVPEFKNVQRVTGINIAREIVEFVKGFLKRGK